MKRDITELRERLRAVAESVKGLEKGISDSTTKQEFYDFIRELNEELSKLERHVATHDALERLQAKFGTQIRELEEEARASRQLARQLKRVEGLEQKAKELRSRLEALESLRKRLEEIERNYVDWKEFFRRLKELNGAQRAAELKKLSESIGERLDATRDELTELSDRAATKIELRDSQKRLGKIIKSQARMIREQQASLKKLEREVSRLKGEKQMRVVKGRQGIIERGLNSLSAALKGKSHWFPIIFTILIIGALVAGLYFFRHNLFSPELYLDPKSVECREKFECKKLENASLLVNCRFDESLGNCHCDAKPANLTNCPKE